MQELPKPLVSPPAMCWPTAVLTSCRTTPKSLFPPNPPRETTPGALLLESVRSVHHTTCRYGPPDGRDSACRHRLLHAIARLGPAASRLSHDSTSHFLS